MSSGEAGCAIGMLTLATCLPARPQAATENDLLAINHKKPAMRRRILEMLRLRAGKDAVV